MSGPDRTGDDGDPGRDAWLHAALRHAPDADDAPPAAVSEAILRAARAQVEGPRKRTGLAATATTVSLGERLRRLWLAAGWPQAAAAFGGLGVVVLATALWQHGLEDAAQPADAVPAPAGARSPAASTAPAPMASSDVPTASPAPRAQLAPAAPTPPSARAEATAPSVRTIPAAPPARTAGPAPAVPSPSAIPATPAAAPAAAPPAAPAPPGTTLSEASPPPLPSAAMPSPTPLSDAASMSPPTARARSPSGRQAAPDGQQVPDPAAGERRMADALTADPTVAAAAKARLLAVMPSSTPVGALRQAIQAGPSRWAWRDGAGATHAAGPALLNALARLDTATRGRWTAQQADGAASTPAMAILHDGRPRHQLAVGATMVIWEALDAPASGRWQAEVGEAEAAALREALAAAR